MSLNHLESQVEDTRAQAERVQAQWANTNETLEHDTSLTEEGKQAAIAKAYDDARTQLGALRKRETELIDSKKSALERSIFGITQVAAGDPSALIAYRDAQDRARRCEHADEARDLMRSAQMSDDKSLASAVLAAAIQHDWRGIVDEFAQAHPRDADDLKDLRTLHRHDPLTSGMHYAIFPPSSRTNMAAAHRSNY